jgi:hypothetical protein
MPEKLGHMFKFAVGQAFNLLEADLLERIVEWL